MGVADLVPEEPPLPFLLDNWTGWVFFLVSQIVELSRGCLDRCGQVGQVLD